MHVYFLGIGGTGIGPLAEIAHQAGYQVSGLDKQNSDYIEYLKAHGISDITVSESADAISEAHKETPIDWLVYSSAVPMEEIGSRQLEQAKLLGIKCTKRDQFISEFTKENHLKMIAVAGTHGKTTTTAMLAWLFVSLSKPISYLIPAKVNFGEMGSFDKDSEYFIYEADEYDRNFLSFTPRLSVISGVSWDHHEIYPTREQYIAAFNDFIGQSQQTVIWSTDADYLAARGDKLLIQNNDEPKINDISLKGLYNRRDAWLAIVSFSNLTSESLGQLIPVINNFPGLSRRMEEIYPGLYSDYAHTPEKIRGAINTALEISKDKGHKLIVIYEPLTNRRQIHIADEYKDCFNGASHVYWLPSYLAREDPKDRVIEPIELVNKLADPSIAEPSSRDEPLIEVIKDHLANGDMVVAMAGGGGSSLDEWLRSHFKTDRQS